MISDIRTLYKAQDHPFFLVLFKDNNGLLQGYLQNLILLQRHLPNLWEDPAEAFSTASFVRLTFYLLFMSNRTIHMSTARFDNWVSDHFVLLGSFSNSRQIKTVLPNISFLLSSNVESFLFEKHTQLLYFHKSGRTTTHKMRAGKSILFCN